MKQTIGVLCQELKRSYKSFGLWSLAPCPCTSTLSLTSLAVMASAGVCIAWIEWFKCSSFINPRPDALKETMRMMGKDL